MGMNASGKRGANLPATQTNKRPQWVVGGVTILTFVALLYLVELIDQLMGGRLDNNGIRPTTTDGLWGIIFAPAAARQLAAPDGQHDPAAGAGVPDDTGRNIPVRLGHRDHLDPRRFRHLAHRQLRQQLRPDRPHRRLRPDLRISDLPAGVRVLRPQAVARSSSGWWCSSSTAAFCSARCPCSTSAVACPGRAIYAAGSPASWPRICCPLPNARLASGRRPPVRRT